MLGFLKKLFGAAGADDEPPPQAAEAVEHEGYRIVPAPRKDAGGWRIEGLIERDIDGETRQHRFIRADVYHDRDETIRATVQKARRIIDEQGERIFGDG